MKLLATLLFVFSASAYADDMPCDVLVVKDENRPATIGAKCQGYESQGFIANYQIVSAVTLDIYGDDNSVKRQVTIANPGSSIRSYARPQSNEVVMRELKRIGVKVASNEGIRLSSFMVKPDAKVYKESGPLGGGLGKTPVMTKVETPPANVVGDCNWASTPQIVTSPSCGNNNLCYGRVVCKEKTAVAMCQPIGDKKMECPGADACAADPSVKFMDSAKPSPAPESESKELRGWNLDMPGGFHLDGAGDETPPTQSAN